MMEQTTLVIRNYIYKCAQSVPETQHDIALKNNMVHLLFYLVSMLYKKPADQFMNGEIDVVSCTCCLIYLLENFQKDLPEPIFAHTFEFFKANISKFKSKLMKVVNSQLLGLLCWVAPVQILNIAFNNKILPIVIRELTSYTSKYEYDHERCRVILGINAIL